jgi:hypothetical protein
MAGLASLMGANAPLRYHPFRTNYEIKHGNSYTPIDEYLKPKKELLRQDDSTYLFLDCKTIDQLQFELNNCVEWDDRICVEPLKPSDMRAKNMQEVLDWLDRYVNSPYAATNRGYLGANALLSFARGIGSPAAAGTILGGIGKPRR